MTGRSLQLVLFALILALGLAAPAAMAGHAIPPAPENEAAPASPPDPAVAGPSDGAPDAAAPAVSPAPADTAPAPPEPEQKAAAPTLDDLLQPVASLSTAIEKAEKRLEQGPREQKELAAFRSEIETIQFDAKAAAEKLVPRLEEVKSQIAKLGEAPAAGAPPEAPEVALERERLNKIASEIDGAIKTAGLVEVRARQLVGRVQQVRQSIFTRFLLLQTDSPLRAKVWRDFGQQVSEAETRTSFIADNWWSVAVLNWMALLGVLAATVLAYVILRAIRNHILRSRHVNGTPVSPPLPQRAATAAWVMVAFAIPPSVAAAVLYVGLDATNLLYWQVERFAQSALFSFLVFIAISSLARAVLQPRRPAWRIFDLSDRASITICRAVQAIAAVYALDFLARRTVAILSLSASVSVVSAFIASLLYGALIGVIVSTPFTPWTLPPGAPVSRWRPYRLKAALIVLAAVLIATALLGYVSLSRFIAGQTLMTGAGVLVIALLHIAIRCVRAAPSESEVSLTSNIARHLRLEQKGQERVASGMRLVLNLLLVSIAIPLILLAWGVTVADILGWLRTAIFGFEVNGVRISLARIFFAVVLFLLLLSATRLFQRWLRIRASTHSQWDTGLVNSIYTGAGYIGFAVAALAAVAYAGFDITSLAIVAGALSVGIGFGLQSIVNNFVSGIVLLIERPIKVGDWIALKDGEGYVRRISVRSTEIETFERASLIIPNSEMISQTVTNLTHRNQLGRLNVSVRISYASDPEVACRVLEQVAAENTSILRHPAPIVVLDNLGDQAMEYSLRVYLADINQSLRVQTEVRIAIVKGLREAGIDIPYFAVQVGHSTGPLLSPNHVTVRISTALSADPDAVLEALSTAAQRADGARSDPEPEIAFENVGDNALEFSVAVKIADDAKPKAVETALRSAIVKTLRERGIEIAGSLHDVRLRDLEGLETFLTRLAEDRAHQVREQDVPKSAAGMPKGRPS